MTNYTNENTGQTVDRYKQDLGNGVERHLTDAYRGGHYQNKQQSITQIEKKVVDEAPHGFQKGSSQQHFVKYENGVRHDVRVNEKFETRPDGSVVVESKKNIHMQGKAGQFKALQ